MVRKLFSGYTATVLLTLTLTSIGWIGGCGDRGQTRISANVVNTYGLHFSLENFRGMGKLAVLAAASGKHFEDGSSLFVIESGKGSRTVSLHQLTDTDDALSADFSPNGEAIKVLRLHQNGSRLWLMAPDGTRRTELPPSIIAATWIPNSSNLLISDGATVHTVSLGGLKSVDPVNVQSNAEVCQLLPNRKGTEVAVVFLINWRNLSQRYENVYIYALKNGIVADKGRPVFHTTPGNGIILASFSYHGGDIYGWLDPAFGHSVMADGQPLYALHLATRQLKSIVKTLPSVRAVQIADNGTTIVWKGEDRYFYEGAGQVEGLTSNTLDPLAPAPGKIQFLPVLSHDGTKVAYAEGTALKGVNSTPSQAVNWYRAVPQLVVHSLTTGQTLTLMKAGHGITSPFFTQDGSRILYMKGGSIQWIEADGQTDPHIIVTEQPSTASEEKQAIDEYRLEIADYSSVNS